MQGFVGFVEFVEFVEFVRCVSFVKCVGGVGFGGRVVDGLISAIHLIFPKDL